ncbi:MAG: hypothetical protein LBC11_03085 [Puniceicoccales bacterium]|nr:hypothetical protein [Puniceicoccales bacterium]
MSTILKIVSRELIFRAEGICSFSVPPFVQAGILPPIASNYATAGAFSLSRKGFLLAVGGWSMKLP